MRIGQTSLVVFGAKLLAAVLGFLATLYFARVLGAEILGYYFLVLALYNWLSMGGRLGFGSAVTKRISEGEERSAFLTAAILIIGTTGLFVVLLILTFRDAVDAYVGAQVAGFVAFLVLMKLFYATIYAALKGERLVHVAALLDPVKIGFRSLVQVGLVFAGFALTGMLVGYIAGGIIVGILGIFFLSVGVARPRKRHFRSLFDFAKFSWLGKLKSRSFNDVDILVLGFFVPSALVGVYAIAWSIANFLTIFGRAVSSTLFPELSRADARNDDAFVSKLVTDSLTYGGLVIIPGFFGGLILGERLLRIYGDEFTQGTIVLGILILATLIYSYQKQFLNALNGVDRPDVAFKVNAVFIVANAVLNVGLVYWIGWIGAAIATVLSTFIGLSLSYFALRQLIEFDVPVGEITRQFVAAIVMSGTVLGGLSMIETTGILDHNVIIVLIFVTLGAGVYFLTLLAISRQFRATVSANSPFPIPILS